MNIIYIFKKKIDQDEKQYNYYQLSWIINTNDLICRHRGNLVSG